MHITGSIVWDIIDVEILTGMASMVWSSVSKNGLQFQPSFQKFNGDLKVHSKLSNVHIVGPENRFRYVLSIAHMMIKISHYCRFAHHLLLNNAPSNNT